MASDPRAARAAGVLGLLAGVMGAAGIVIVVAVSPHELTASPVAVLGGWLAAAVGTVVSAESSAARTVAARSSTRSSSGARGTAGNRAVQDERKAGRKVRQSTTAVVSVLLLAELGWFLVAFAREGAYGFAGAVGGALLVLLGVTTWRILEVARTSAGFTAAESPPTVCAFLLSEASLGWLAVRFGVDGPLWGAAAVGGGAVLLAAAFWLIVRSSSSDEDGLLLAHGGVAFCSLAGAVTETAVRVSAVVAWVAGGAAVLVVLGLWLRSLVRAARRASGRAVETSPGPQVLGILVPLASLVWVFREEDPWGVTDGAGPVVVGGALAGAAALLLVLQALVLGWLNTDPWRVEVTRLARAAVQDAADFRRRYGDRFPGSGSGPSHGTAWSPSRRRHDEEHYENELHRRRTGLLRDVIPHDRSRLASALRQLQQPFASGRLLDVEAETALATGLAIEQVWPRFAAVTQDAYGWLVRDRERAVRGWRLVVAAALCTTFVWLSLPLFGADRVVALAASGPLLLVLVALPRARASLIAARRLKAEAIRFQRYDLLKTLRIAPPEERDLILLAPALSGDGLLYDEMPWSVDPARPYSETVEARTHAEAREDLREVVREQLDAFALRFQPLTRPAADRSTPFTDAQLAQLAEQVARKAVEPVAERLKSHVSQSQRTFQDEVNAAVRESVREAVEKAAGGAPLSNFVGYVAIELDRRPRPGGAEPSARADRGTIKAPAGGRVDLVLSVVRDARAQHADTVVQTHPDKDFFVFEPVRLEGGRDDDTVTFDALVDSSTLTPLPQRRNLSVTDEKQTTFGFQLPSEEGRHEVWFQLYQSGRLVQVTAIGIEALAGPTASAAAAT